MGQRFTRMPLDAVTILAKAFRLVFANFPVLLILVAIHLLVIVAAASFLFGTEMFAIFDSRGAAVIEALASRPILGWRGTCFVLVAILSYSFLFAAGSSVLFGAADEYGTDPGSRQNAGALRMGRRVLMAGLRHTLALFLVGAVFTAMLAALAGISLTLFAYALLGPPALVPILSLIILMAVVFLHAVFLPAPAIVVVETLSLRALTRAFEMTAGYRWSLAGLVFVSALLFILSVNILRVTHLGGMFEGEVGRAVSMIIAVLSLTITTGLMIAIVTLVYMRLRKIKSGVTGDDIARIFA